MGWPSSTPSKRQPVRKNTRETERCDSYMKYQVPILDYFESRLTLSLDYSLHLPVPWFPIQLIALPIPPLVLPFSCPPHD
jgi:hypothetical protein